MELYAQKVHDEIREKEALLTKFKDRVYEAGNKAADLKMSFENLCGILFLFLIYKFSFSGYFMPYFQRSYVESAKSDIDALAEAENDLMIIEHDLIEVERVQFTYLLNYSLTAFVLLLYVL